MKYLVLLLLLSGCASYRNNFYKNDKGELVYSENYNKEPLSLPAPISSLASPTGTIVDQFTLNDYKIYPGSPNAIPNTRVYKGMESGGVEQNISPKN